MKICFRCGIEKPLSEYYVHKQMGDGHLNKCKTCTKADSEARRIKKMKDPEWTAAEMERHRIKQADARRNGTACVLTGEKRREVHRRQAEKFPEKTSARTKLGNAVRDGRVIRKACEVCGSTDSEAHHDDYSKPLDVIWLCPKHHAERHVEARRKKLFEVKFSA